MNDQFTILVNGAEIRVLAGSSVAAVVAMTGAVMRRSVKGELRGPLCGMGICFECRVTVNGKMHTRSCQISCEPGMEVRTDA